MTKNSITKILLPLTPPSPQWGEGGVRGILVIWILSDWNLFGIWDLVIGI